MHGHASMVVPLARYDAKYSPIPYVWEGNPGEGPVYPANVPAALARTLNNTCTGQSCIFQDQTRTHTALQNQLYRSYSREYWTGLIQPGTGIATISLLDMYTHLYTNY